MSFIQMLCFGSIWYLHDFDGSEGRDVLGVKGTWTIWIVLKDSNTPSSQGPADSHMSYEAILFIDSVCMQPHPTSLLQPHKLAGPSRRRTFALPHIGCSCRTEGVYKISRINRRMMINLITRISNSSSAGNTRTQTWSITRSR